MSSRPVQQSIGPLHQLAHAQLLLAAEREGWVADAVAAALGPDAQLALEAVRAEHPLELDADLERLLDGRDPHAVLEDLVRRSHAREGAAYAALVVAGGDEAEVRLRLVAWDHGAEIGRRVAASARAGSGPAVVLDLLTESLLEGLPCRSSLTLVSDEALRVEWRHQSCPFKEAWDSAGAPFELSCNITSAWIRGFASGVDPKVEYRRPRAVSRGDSWCEHELIVID